MASVGPAIAGVGVVEVGQDVPGSAFECPAQRDDFCEGARHARADGEVLARCAAALIESIPSKVYDVEGIHDRPRATCQAGRSARF